MMGREKEGTQVKVGRNAEGSLKGVALWTAGAPARLVSTSRGDFRPSHSPRNHYASNKGQEPTRSKALTSPAHDAIRLRVDGRREPLLAPSSPGPALFRRAQDCFPSHRPALFFASGLAPAAKSGALRASTWPLRAAHKEALLPNYSRRGTNKA